MASFQKLTSVELQNRIRRLAEIDGLESSDILNRIQDETFFQLAQEEDSRRGMDTEEPIPGEIKIISQGLAYRKADLSDLDELFALLSAAYREETEGEEAFRGSPIISKHVIEQYILDSEYEWLLMEAPCGFGIESDGVILGVSCFCTNGKSIKNGAYEGQVGSLRFFGILPRYKGLCLGRRLLFKIEELVFQRDCTRVLVSIPSPRRSIIDWLERRGYVNVGEVPYPFHQLNHLPLLSPEEIKLILFVKPRPNEGNKLLEQNHLPPIFRRIQPTISDCPFHDEDEMEDLGVD